MVTLIKNNILIIIFVAAAIMFFAWFGMSDTVSNSNLLVAERSEDISLADQEILKLLLDMRSIQLDSGIFENPAFSSLRDFGKNIVPEPVGRENPFIPLVPEGDAQNDASAELFAPGGTQGARTEASL